MNYPQSSVPNFHLINFILINFMKRMRPDYARKLFSDQRSRYIFLLISLATGSSGIFQ
jgi:hypothetical protein